MKKKIQMNEKKAERIEIMLEIIRKKEEKGRIVLDERKLYMKERKVERRQVL